jgi:DNA polymerase
MSSATLGNVIPGLERGVAFVALDCTRCVLSKTRTQVVPAEGSRKAIALFVGEAPGPDEDRIGRPFIGRAGRILRDALAEAGWRGDEVWITNTVKCFPFDIVEGKKKIRAPNPDERAGCSRHLAAELEAFPRALVVALGRTAAGALAGTAVALDERHGTIFPRSTGVGDVFVTFHPSGLHYRKGRREAFLADLRRARALALERCAP